MMTTITTYFVDFADSISFVSKLFLFVYHVQAEIQVES